MILDEGKMEKLMIKYGNAPCINCTYFEFIADSFEHKCPFFENGVIPNDIMTGINQHTTKHPNQIKDGLFTRRWKVDM